MNKLKFIVIQVLMASGLFMVSCNNVPKENNSDQEVTADKEQEMTKEDTAHEHHDELAMKSYQCPMKCEDDKTYEESGACPVCNMDLKEVE